MTINSLLGGCSSVKDIANKTLSKTNDNVPKVEDATNKQSLSNSDSNKSRIIKLNLGSNNAIEINLDEKLNEELLTRLNDDELMVIRNGYYAKYGYEFPDGRYLNYFNQFKWYKPLSDNVENELTVLDKENIRLIDEYDKSKVNNIEIPTSKSNSRIKNNRDYIMKLDLGSGYFIYIDLNERLSEEILWKLTEEELSYVRNGYYAKHGYKFSQEKYLNYFKQYSWYNPISSNVEKSLSSIDQDNVKLVQEYEDTFTSYQQENNYIGYFCIYFDRGAGDYIMIDLEQGLEESLLCQLNSTELALLRNAYYAKHGYIFSMQEYSNYFYQYEWYYPDSKNVESRLTNLDKSNIALVQKYE